MALKIAALAPIDRASVSTAAVAKPGERRNRRLAYRTSCRSVCIADSLPSERQRVLPAAARASLDGRRQRTVYRSPQERATDRRRRRGRARLWRDPLSIRSGRRQLARREVATYVYKHNLRKTNARTEPSVSTSPPSSWHDEYESHDEPLRLAIIEHTDTKVIRHDQRRTSLRRQQGRERREGAAPAQDRPSRARALRTAWWNTRQRSRGLAARRTRDRCGNGSRRASPIIARVIPAAAPPRVRRRPRASPGSSRPAARRAASAWPRRTGSAHPRRPLQTTASRRSASTPAPSPLRPRPRRSPRSCPAAGSDRRPRRGCRRAPSGC